MSRVKIDTNTLVPECRPKVLHAGDAAFDLSAAIDFEAVNGYPVKVPLGVQFKIPTGHFGILTHRSSLAFKFNCTCSLGIIDSSFNGQVHALIFNHGRANQFFKKGDRICQIIFMPIGQYYMANAQFDETGKKGFGSSGGYNG